MPAAAQDQPWSFAFGAASDNRSKDVSKSDLGAYVWGEAEWGAASGLYAGPAFETIDAGGSRLELSPSAGFRTERLGFEWDANVAYKYRVDADPGYDHDAWEFTADAARAIGPVKGRVRLQHSPDGTGSTGAWTWVAARAGVTLAPKLKAQAEIGHRSQENAPDYVGWNVGVEYAVSRQASVSLTYYSTDADADLAGRQYEDALVAGIAFGF
ncbi:hypothetical protein ASG17_07085 [Brevundimonas sp. Leaf363]|nr:hypothetical protein ASG17_07085 [Brevundimonas sp. Leaf363]